MIMDVSPSVGTQHGGGERSTHWTRFALGIPLTTDSNALDKAQSESMSTSGDEGVNMKVRKPYTITKQRERWTEEEHQKFLEALKLYGRAWRRIEEHIGTKTAVQIRSHAQKFFSKLERDATAGGGLPPGEAHAIDIPPPRPKRKPSHPYPRKAGGSFYKNSEDDSPLLSAVSAGTPVVATLGDGCMKHTREQDEVPEVCEDSPKRTKQMPQKENPPLQEGEAMFARHSPAINHWGHSESSFVPFQHGTATVAHHLAAALSAGMRMQQGNNLPAKPEGFQNSLMEFSGFQQAYLGRFHGQQVPHHPAYGNLQNLARIVGLAAPRGMVLPWSQYPAVPSPPPRDLSAMAAAAAAAAAFWPALVSGATTTGMPEATSADYESATQLGANGSAEKPNTPEDSGAAAAVAAATLAAASAWWALQGAVPPGTVLPGVGAVYNPMMLAAAATAANAAVSIPTPHLTHQARMWKQEAERCPEGSGVDGEAGTTEDFLLEIASSRGTSMKSSAARRAERALRVKESKARRGTGIHLSTSSPGESALKPMNSGCGEHGREAGQGTEATRSIIEPASGSLSHANTSREALREVNKQKNEQVGKRERMVSPGSSQDVEEDDRRKLMRGRSVSGSNSLPGKYAVGHLDKRAAQLTPPEASSGSDGSGSDGTPVDGNVSGAGSRSSNSSACGAQPGGTQQSGWTDGSSDVEGEVLPIRVKKDGPSSSAADMAERDRENATKNNMRHSTSGISMNMSKDGEKHSHNQRHLVGGAQDVVTRVQKSAALDGEQRKEVTGEGRMAFQALFSLETLPRSFSPPPRSSLKPNDPLAHNKVSPSEGTVKQSQFHGDFTTRVTHSRATPCEGGVPPILLKSYSKVAGIGFNAWEPLRAVDGCESSITMSSLRPGKSPDELGSLERKRSLKKMERCRSVATSWLKLGTQTSSLQGEEGVDDQDTAGTADESCRSKQELADREEDVSSSSLDSSERGKKSYRSKLCVDGRLDNGFGFKNVTTKANTLALHIAGSQAPLSTVSSTGSVKYSGLGFVPYQRVSLEPSLKL